MLSERSLDDVICGICGTVGQVYFGDGNKKNCCSIDAIKYEDDKSDDHLSMPTTLEDFISSLKDICIEKIIFTSSNLTTKVEASKVPPIIAPSLRGERVYNTELQKKSVYLGNKILKKDEINGVFLYMNASQTN
ncbi:Hypothetical predicted protein [Paramuricea clavata]|uniref:Uncharacterized protein n=1 Tax=Paramuricea clavata TaxID=317549 RepID=A0A6S7IQN8_PARCT|nr:Hypothetical predicted protein [Paramuricea clavata]